MIRDILAGFRRMQLAQPVMLMMLIVVAVGALLALSTCDHESLSNPADPVYTTPEPRPQAPAGPR